MDKTITIFFHMGAYHAASVYDVKKLVSLGLFNGSFLSYSLLEKHCNTFGYKLVVKN